MCSVCTDHQRNIYNDIACIEGQSSTCWQHINRPIDANQVSEVAWAGHHCLYKLLLKQSLVYFTINVHFCSASGCQSHYWTFRKKILRAQLKLSPQNQIIKNFWNVRTYHIKNDVCTQIRLTLRLITNWQPKWSDQQSWSGECADYISIKTKSENIGYLDMRIETVK